MSSNDWYSSRQNHKLYYHKKGWLVGHLLLYKKEGIEYYNPIQALLYNSYCSTNQLYQRILGGSTKSIFYSIWYQKIKMYFLTENELLWIEQGNEKKLKITINGTN